MKTFRIGIARIGALVAFAMTVPVGLINAQQGDSPVYVNLSFQEHFFSTSYPYGGSMYVSLIDETGAAVYTYVYAAPAYQWTSSTSVTAKLYPNKNYTVSMYASGGSGYVLFEHVSAIVGGELKMDGIVQYERSITSGQNQTFALRVQTNEAQQDLGAGQGSSITPDKPIWYLGLGKIRNGESAGSIGFRQPDFSDTNFFKPDTLVYDSPNTAEVDVVRTSGVLRQVFAREVLVDIQTVVSGTSYKLEVYPRSQVGTLSGGVYQLSGSPFVTYTVLSLSPGATGMRITRDEDSMSWETSLELAGSVWTLRDWRVQDDPSVYPDSKVVTNYTTSTAATVSHSGPAADGSGTETPLEWNKTFYGYSWGNELIDTTFGAASTPPESVKVETQYSYYTSTGSGGVQKYLKWVKQPNGSWSKFDYYDTSTTSGSKGMIKRVYRQWLDMSSNPDSPLTSNSTYENWTYAAASDGSYRLPSSRIEYAPSGTMLSKTTWTYNHWAAVLNNEWVAEVIRYDYWGTGGTDRLTTTSRNYGDHVNVPYLRGKPVSVEYPDGRKDSYAYFDGSWSETNKSFTSSSGGNDRLILCYHGQTTGGTSMSSTTKNGISWQMASVNMVAGKSTVSERVVDTHGRVVFEAENVYTSGYSSDSTASRISGAIHRFDTHGREYETVDIARSVAAAELKTVRTYSAGLMLTETAPEGKVTNFEYDRLLRLGKKTDNYVNGLGGPPGYPEKVTEFKFDGANRIAESYSCSGCGAGATFYEYDGAGRLLVKSEESPEEGGGGLPTTFGYPSIARVDTTLPSGATREEVNYLDGRPKSVAGSAQPPSTIEYVAESTGLKVTRKNGTTTTNGWVEEKHDLLDRVTKRSVPTWGWPYGPGNKVLETRFEYNTAGQLWRERTYYQDTSGFINADRLFVYEAGGRLYRRGLDINNDGSLTTNSNDRIVDVDETILQDIWGWQLVTTVNTYATASSPTATEVSQTYTRLTGFNRGLLSDSKFVIGDEIAFDSSDRYSLRWDYANPSSKSIESDFQWQGFSSGSQKGNNGYVSEVLGKNGEKQGYEYDTRGRLSHVRSRWTGSSYAEDTAYTYHGDTQFVDTITHGGIATSYSYAWGSPSGSRQVTVTDAAGGTSHTLYNAMDLPWQIWGSAAQPVQFDYDAVGRRTSMTTWRSEVTAGDFSDSTWPPSPGTGATTTWDLQPATGLLMEKIWPDVDPTTQVHRKWTYTYTPLGAVSTREWARIVSGTTRSKTTYAYSPTTAELTGVSYNDGTHGTIYTYKRTGAPDMITDVTGTHTFDYRSDLQLASETLDPTFYGASRTITPTYESSGSGTVNGRATGFQFKTGSSAESSNTFAFDASTGRISTVAASGTGAPTFTYGYATGANWVESVTLNSGGYARINTLLSNRRVLGKVQTSWSGSNVALYDSTITDWFDSRGLREKVQQTGSLFTVDPNDALVEGTTTFTYNERAELTKADFDGTSKDYDWTYDFMGKRTQAKREGTYTTTYAAIVDAGKDANQYASITGDSAESGLAYDADGNMITDGTWYYRYDGENRLKEMEKRNGTQTLQFVYDYVNRRVRKTVRSGGPTAGITSSTKFVWSGMALAAELNAGTAEAQSGTTLSKSYLWGVDFSNASGVAGGAGGLLAVYQGSAWYYPTCDATGNVTGYLNSSGSVTAGYEYNAYGQIIASRGSSTSFAFGFSTQYTDHESGLVYYGMRYYQPRHGRFINRDPIGEAGGLNLYSFVGNSPSNRWDTLGLRTECGMVFVGHATKCESIGTAHYDEHGVYILPEFKCHPDLDHPIYEFRCIEVPDATTPANSPSDRPTDPTGPAPNKPDEKEWEPNKADCDGLRAQYPGAFAGPGTNLSQNDARVAATIRAGVYSEITGWEWHAQYYRNGNGSYSYDAPMVAGTPFGGGQISFRDLPSDASFLGIAHSHSLGNYDTYLSRMNFWRPDVTPQSQQEWAIARERFSGDPGDLGVAARNGHEYSLHTPSGNLRYVTPESALAGLASGNLNGQAMPGAPSAGDAAKIVSCIKAGK